MPAYEDIDQETKDRFALAVRLLSMPGAGTCQMSGGKGMATFMAALAAEYGLEMEEHTVVNAPNPPNSTGTATIAHGYRGYIVWDPAISDGSPRGFKWIEPR